MRRGVIQDRHSTSWEVEPLFHGAERQRVKGLRLHVEENGARFSRQYTLGIFREEALAFAQRLIREERLSGEEDLETIVLARQPQAAAASHPGVQIEVKQAPLPLTAGRLSEWLSRSTDLNSKAHSEEDTPTFIMKSALEQARSFCRIPGSLEGAALLVGRLFQQHEPEPEIFAVIEASFEAQHARQEKFSLTMTNETYLYFERQLALRRKHLNRPEELLLATAHGHNFAPSLDSQGEANCPTCPLRPECQLHSAFFSADDVEFHAALFHKQPYAIGLVWGLDPRFDDVLKAYGFRDGAMQERSIWVVDQV